MNGFKRRVSETPPVQETVAPKAETPTPVAIPAHVDRTLILLTTRMQNALERIEAMEERMDDLFDQLMNAPTHGDVLEVRMHGAKLAAELARSTVELRGEIGMASEEARRAARAARNAAAMNEAEFESSVLNLVVEEADDEGRNRFSEAG